MAAAADFLAERPTSERLRDLEATLAQALGEKRRAPGLLVTLAEEGEAPMLSAILAAEAEIPGDEPPRIGGERKLQVFQWGAAYYSQFFLELFRWRKPVIRDWRTAAEAVSVSHPALELVAS